MEMDAALCYEAIQSRDRRFDGRFFTAIVTTGVYCRPGCPARTPKPENILFFACAAAAEAAGFRPCMRCRPESSPGTPTWLAAAETVSRALRWIAEGVLDHGGRIDELAARLGLSARQLRRLFAEHLGASPVEFASARRTHFARRLIDETDLPMAETAFASGFESIRQFNHAMRETFQQTPTELRRRRRPPPPGDRYLVLRLPYRPPLAWGAMIEFLRARATPGVEAVDHNTYRRTVEVGGRAGVLELMPAAGEHYLTLRLNIESHEGLIQVVERARRIFDLGADPLAIDERLAASPVLTRAVAATPGLRVPGVWDSFELAVRAILGQQITVQGATTLSGRLVRRFGTPVSLGDDPALTHLFPSPAVLAHADLTTIGLPRARAEAIRGLAAAVAAGELVLDAPQGLDEAMPRLRALPGIGEWSAHYIAMRALREPDAFPATDLGLRRAVAGDGAPVSDVVLRRMAEAWRPWRAYAAMYLWAGQRLPRREEKIA